MQVAISLETNDQDYLGSWNDINDQMNNVVGSGPGGEYLQFIDRLREQLLEQHCTLRDDGAHINKDINGVVNAL